MDPGGLELSMLTRLASNKSTNRQPYPYFVHEKAEPDKEIHTSPGPDSKDQALHNL